MTDKAQRQALLDACQALAETGLNKGTSGNVSLRVGDGFLITPSGVPVEKLSADMMVSMDMQGGFFGEIKPSSEWRFHLDIYQQRTDVNAVVHAHSIYATAYSTLRKDLPPFHYMIAVAGGDSIRCAPYALFGTQDLSNHVVAAMDGRQACLMANHGMIAAHANLEKALYVAVEVENLCQQYMAALQVGEPVLLTSEEMQVVQAAFKGYGALAKK